MEFKNINDTLSPIEFNDYVTLLRCNFNLNENISINQSSIKGQYATYEFDFNNSTIIDNGILITEETLTAENIISLVNPTFLNSNYIFNFKVMSIEDYNLYQDDNVNYISYETFDVTLNSEDDTALLDLSNYDIGMVVLFDVEVEIKHNIPSIIDKGTVKDYTIEFSQSSYTTSGTVEVSCTVLDNDEPVADAVVTFTSSASSTVTATTDANGIATAEITFSESTILTASFENISATCTVTVQSYLFYDDCSTNRASEYTTKGNQTITYNNQGYYTIKTTSQSCPNVKLNSFTAPNKVKISADFRVTSGSNIQPKICLFDETQNKGYGLRITQNNSRWNLQTYNSWTDCGNNLTETTQSVSLNTWYHFELTVDGNDLTGKIYDSNGSLLNTITSSGSLNLNSTGNYVGIGLNYTSNTYMDIKEIKVEAL